MTAVSLFSVNNVILILDLVLQFIKLKIQWQQPMGIILYFGWVNMHILAGAMKVTQ